jgi:hypothetical protein
MLIRLARLAMRIQDGHQMHLLPACQELTIARFDASIRAATSNAGLPSIYYVAPSAWWELHSICEPRSRSWFIQPDLARILGLQFGLEHVLRTLGSAGLAREPAWSQAMYFHPTLTGQQALAVRVLKQLGRGETPCPQPAP